MAYPSAKQGIEVETYELIPKEGYTPPRIKIIGEVKHHEFSTGEAELMQFTGLKDLQNREVYEGDIFTFRCSGCLVEHKGEIVWLDDVGCWGFNNHEEKTKSPLIQPVFDEDGNLVDQNIFRIERVIGNIYENSELLK